MLLFISHNIGSMVFKNKNTLSTFAVGFSFIIATLFIFTDIMVRNRIPTPLFHTIIACIFIVLATMSFQLKLPKITRTEALIILIVFMFMMLQSFRYTLGEQMGDSLFIFNIIDKNIISENINELNIHSGMVGSEFEIGLLKSNIPYYFMFSSINYYLTAIVKHMGFSYIPPYTITMWVSNLLFYFMSSIFIINIRRELKPKKIESTLLLILWLGFYTGSIYYNISLAHIVVTMLVMIVAYSIFEFYMYMNSLNKSHLVSLLILLWSFIGYGGTGGMYLIVFSFGLVSVTLLYRSKDAYIQIPILITPLILYSRSLDLIPISNNILIFSIFLTIVVLILMNRFELIHKYISILFPVILILVWVLVYFHSKQTIESYTIDFEGFMTPQGGTDRTQDYFSFNRLDITIRNLIYYMFLLVTLAIKKTRPIGIFISISLLFFINPWTKPFILTYFSRSDVYNRIFFTIFNSGTVGIGIISLHFISKYINKITKNILYALLILLLLIPTVEQSFGYFYHTYVPREKDYNIIYKMSNNQIEVLEKMRQIIVIESIQNPRIISQIFGTGMYAPEFSVLGYNVSNQRYGRRYLNQELYEIFYTPAIPADDGPRLEAPVNKMCSLLVNIEIDFVLFDKNMIVYDKKVGDYLPIYWYIRDCATLIYENDRYSLYRFYFR